VATAAASAVAATGTGSGPGLDGAALYTQRCSACHDQARADVPPRRQLARLSPGVIFDKLAFGSMQSQALGLDDAGLEALARWLASPAALATAPAVDR
jgi:mono/diheme cytochrome c family protein